MDITTSDPDVRLNDIFTRRNTTFIIITILSTIGIWMYNTNFGLMATGLVLFSVNYALVDSWNRELRDDSYASLSQLYISYTGVIFFAIILFLSISVYLNTTYTIITTLIVTLAYKSLLSHVAFRDIDNYEVERNSYSGGPIVYTDKQIYYDHVEQVAHEE